MKKQTTGAGTAPISDMKKPGKQELLIAAATLAVAATLCVFKVIDSPRYSSRESVSVTLTHREATAQSGKVNINTAGVEELSALSGIGEAKARAIVEYREENGYFRSAYEFENVEGIGPALVDANIDRITL